MTIVHLNIVGFKAAVAAAKDKSLRGQPYVIAGAVGGRALALDCSGEAIKQGVTPGMPLVAAERHIKGLMILPPDPAAYKKMNEVIEKVTASYAPVWENDRAGNIYLDISGTRGLFGPPADCGSRVLRDIFDRADIRPAAAVACNKLVSKVATRTIKPIGLIQVHSGTEAEFLSHQDIRILPGMGPGLLQIAAVTGIREIGEIAALSIPEVIALFGKRGPVLRTMAQGIDDSRITEGFQKKRIIKQADFDEDVIDETVIKGAIGTLAGHAGLEMRNEKLGMGCLRLRVIYSDGVVAHGLERVKRLLVSDSEITKMAYNIFIKTVDRRIRIRSIGLCFEDLNHLGYQPDLFEPEAEARNRKIQEAIDKIQNRYGVEKITMGLCLKPVSVPTVSIDVLPEAKLRPRH